jgi:hypothetical protein
MSMQILAVFFGLMFAFAPAIGSAEVPCPIINRTLERGVTGNDVWQLQAYLVSQGDLEARYVTGYFGPRTEYAVARFQCSHKIECIGTPETTGLGKVGPKTRTEIMCECAILAENPYIVTHGSVPAKRP